MVDLAIRAANTQTYQDAGDLVASVFSYGDEAQRKNMTDFWVSKRPLEPGFDLTHYRVATLEGQVVAHVAARPYTLRYGNAELRISGIGAVCTHPNFRKRGYSAAVMRDAITFIAEQGAHLALLNTDQLGLYDRFGFSPVWPYYTVEIASAEAARLTHALTIRPANPDDLPQMARLYQRHWDGRVAFARSPELWKWRGNMRPYTQIVENPDGSICGYIAAWNTLTKRTEIVVDSLEACQTLLAESGKIYQQAGKETLCWYIPPDDSLVSYARQLLDVNVSAEFRHNSGWMGRIIDSQGLLDIITPEIVAQARFAIPGFDAQQLVFGLHSDRVQIALRSQPGTAAHLTHRDFIQIMFGSLRPAALALRPGYDMQPDAISLLEALFPPRMAALAPWDWY